MKPHEFRAFLETASPATVRKITALLMIDRFYCRCGRWLLVLAVLVTVIGALLDSIPVLGLALLLVAAGAGRRPLTSVILFLEG